MIIMMFFRNCVFQSTFLLQVEEGVKPYQVTSQCMTFKKELECLQEQQIILPLGIDETSE